jgi:hypothetical protein
MRRMWEDASRIDTSQRSRAVTFENLSGEAGAGGRAAGGRKGAPSRRVMPGEKVVLADIAGPGTVRHTWMTFPPAPPEVMRAAWMEVYYDGAAEPSVSLPCLDFYALPHGRPAAFDSALVSVHEGRGLNSYFPMPFRKQLLFEFTNGSDRPFDLYFQLDLTLGEVPAESGYLHVAFRRQNPTRMRDDFVIAEGLEGPGRLLGCAVGVRVIDACLWYGEGEFKVYLDGDRDHPTICGTGLEDYVGSAWGMGRHVAAMAGVPLLAGPDERGREPEFVSFYRWHVPDPIVFERELKATIQQIGYARFAVGDEAAFEAYDRSNPAAGNGWRMRERPGVHAHGIAERVDDYCATSYVYCRRPQAVPRLDLAAALADVQRRPYERPSPFEAGFG